MTVIYRNTDTDEVRHYSGRVPRLERSPLWELEQDNEPIDATPKQAADAAGDAAGDADGDGDGGWPHHKGGGNYVLSDGTAVRGKAAATEAQAELNE